MIIREDSKRQKEEYKVNKKAVEEILKKYRIDMTKDNKNAVKRFTRSQSAVYPKILKKKLIQKS